MSCPAAPSSGSTGTSGWPTTLLDSRCCQSGVRLPGQARGISSERAAFSRKRAPKRAEEESSRTTRSSSSGDGLRSSTGGFGVEGAVEITPPDPAVALERLRWFVDNRVDGNELLWRDLYAYVLYHQPESAWEHMRPEFARFQFEDDPEGLAA